jgi:hypothetical protein
MCGYGNTEDSQELSEKKIRGRDDEHRDEHSYESPTLPVSPIAEQFLVPKSPGALQWQGGRDQAFAQSKEF